MAPKRPPITTSVFELYKIGIGPSSSHTVGPMVAAGDFLARVRPRIAEVARVRVALLGSLAATGWGHGTDKAVLAGLEGLEPATGDPARIQGSVERVKREGKLSLGGTAEVPFLFERDLVFDRKTKTTVHPNTLRFGADDAQGRAIAEEEYYSVGGGFVERAQDGGRARVGGAAAEPPPDPARFPYPFGTMAELLEHAARSGKSISELLEANETEGRGRSRDEFRARLLKIWRTMKDCIHAGLHAEGVLPGGLNVPRKAKQYLERLKAELEGERSRFPRIPFGDLRRTHIYALAVGEENAARA
jgi:L-serine dehydratase